MTVVAAIEWLNEMLGLRDPRTGEVHGSGLVYSALLSMLVGDKPGDHQGFNLTRSF